MLNDLYFESITQHSKIADPYCPSCQAEVSFDEKKMMRCCGLTAEAVLIIEPPPVEMIQLTDPVSRKKTDRLMIDPYAVEPTLITEREPKQQARKAWIGYLPKAGTITPEVFRCFVEHQMPLPRCPRCRQPFEFRKDKSETEKPFCSDKSCKVLHCPSHFPKGSMDAWDDYRQKDYPLEKDQFRLTVKYLDSEHVEKRELRSIGLVNYWQEVAMFAAASVQGGGENAEETDSRTTTLDTPPRREHIEKTMPERSPSPAVASESQTPSLEDENSCAEFIRTILWRDPNTITTRKELYTAYQHWCDNTRKYCETRPELYKHVREMSDVREHRGRLDGKEVVRYFIGIRIL